jgi:hypothetical protein
MAELRVQADAQKRVDIPAALFQKLEESLGH